MLANHVVANIQYTQEIAEDLSYWLRLKKKSIIIFLYYLSKYNFAVLVRLHLPLLYMTNFKLLNSY